MDSEELSEVATFLLREAEIEIESLKNKLTEAGFCLDQASQRIAALQARVTELERKP
jgi:hypothetical protein